MAGGGERPRSIVAGGDTARSLPDEIRQRRRQASQGGSEIREPPCLGLAEGARVQMVVPSESRLGIGGAEDAPQRCPTAVIEVPPEIDVRQAHGHPARLRVDLAQEALHVLLRNILHLGRPEKRLHVPRQAPAEGAAQGRCLGIEGCCVCPAPDTADARAEDAGGRRLGRGDHDLELQPPVEVAPTQRQHSAGYLSDDLHGGRLVAVGGCVIPGERARDRPHRLDVCVQGVRKLRILALPCLPGDHGPIESPRRT